MYFEELALNNLQCLIYHKINKQKPIYLIYMHKMDLASNNEE